MQLSRTSRIVLTASMLIGIGAYLAIVDLGVFAGRIHHGVRVSDIDVGGLTEEEALTKLQDRIEELEGSPVRMVAEDIECVFFPEEVGWRPRPFETVATAMDVGRAGGLFAAAADRVDSWLGGVRVAWADSADFTMMQNTLDECSQEAALAGEEIARVKLRYKIRRALVAWPRRAFRIPLRD